MLLELAKNWPGALPAELMEALQVTAPWNARLPHELLSYTMLWVFARITSSTMTSYESVSEYGTQRGNSVILDFPIFSYVFFSCIFRDFPWFFPGGRYISLLFSVSDEPHGTKATVIWGSGCRIWAFQTWRTSSTHKFTLGSISLV